ncbi:MBL fold metallo-hydrolase [uncultured Shewanella sp.]|uniref:MBL fold metallo-hydrolase n=1 Tax=uncultured Shewanella sp. TaxID=173975 RepID=UPI002627A504|nr:MBL fold metallo-hydrolase [uncultured Shewanella sp.]
MQLTFCRHYVRKIILIFSLIMSPLSVGHPIKAPFNATIIGSGAPQYNPHRASASVLITAGKDKLLLDMGNGTQANLAKIGIQAQDLNAIMFTHHHLDHDEEFAPIFIGALLGRHTFTIMGPPKTKQLVDMDLDFYTQDIDYRLSRQNRRLSERKGAFTIKELKGGESFLFEGIRISTLKVPHSIYTLAYRFDYQGQSIVVTGDLTYTDKLAHFAQNADVMIIDSGGMIMSHNKNSQGHNPHQVNAAPSASQNKDKQRTNKIKAHLNLAESSRIAKNANVKTLVYTHFVPGIINKAASLAIIRQQYQGKVIFGKDLLKIGMPKSATKK